MADIWLIRHGQAGDPMGDYDRLSERGVRQCELAGAAWRSQPPPSRVIMGGMRRHRLSAESFARGYASSAERTTWPAATKMTGFDEYDHQAIVRAALAGGVKMPTERSRSAFFGFFRDAMQRWLSGEHDADYPESYATFTTRVTGALDHLVATADSGTTTLVFTSGGPISMCVRHLLGLSDTKGFEVNSALVNASMTLVRTGGGRTSLISLNVHSHFSEHPDLITTS